LVLYEKPIDESSLILTMLGRFFVSCVMVVFVDIGGVVVVIDNHVSIDWRVGLLVGHF
jgi:hypothetical protein